jgi:beta-galactosidase
VVSNAPEVKLFFNDAPVTQKTIPYAAGTLKAIAYDENGAPVAQAVRSSFGDAARLVVKETQIGELIFAEISAVDSAGSPVENANNRVRVTVSGGELWGMDNGDSTDYDPYKTNSRCLFNGRLLAIVRPFAKEKTHISATLDTSDIPVRKIELQADGLTVTAKTFPQNATYHDLQWRLTNETGIDSHLGSLAPGQDGKSVTLVPKGDGRVYVRCLINNGKKHADIFSVYPVTLSGYGSAYINPYAFVSAGLNNASNAPMPNGNERGIVTLEHEASHVGFTGLDFGEAGAAQAELWFFPWDDEPFFVEIWKGMPGEGTLLCKALYDKGSVWNTYQKITCDLTERPTGVQTVCFVIHKRLHMKGFKFLF